jgi:hypothetical protein
MLHRTQTASQPKAVWSAVLRQDQWPSINTDSEYGATRQVAFAEDRIVVVYDAGFAPSQPPKGQWSISNYTLSSLDLKTGAKLAEQTFTGRWGSTPYIYPTPQGLIDVQSNPPRVVDKNLEVVESNIPKGSKDRTAFECGAANCDPLKYILGKNTMLIRKEDFQVVDSDGHAVGGGKIRDWGNFAGASADGLRFALASSYFEGDPDFIVYEYFTIYDATNGKVLSVINMKDLPKRQSSSAFSPDGRYFVAGSPNKLTLYELP